MVCQGLITLSNRSLKKRKEKEKEKIRKEKEKEKERNEKIINELIRFTEM